MNRIDEEMANALCEHFTQITEKYLSRETKTTQCEPLQVLTDFIQERIPSLNDVFNIPPVTELFVNKYIQTLILTNLKVWTILVQRSLNLPTHIIITHMLTHLCNLSLKTNTYPKSGR